jgi:hypothetical protein
MQLVWADEAGRFPDEDGCDPDVVAAQPVGATLLGDWAHRAIAPRSRRTRRSHRRRPG